MESTRFPLPFPFLRAVSEPPQDAGAAQFIIGAMMTPSHAHYGERLLQSCRQFDLPLALFEVPAVHRSISPKCSDDLAGTKANFITFLLDRYGKPVLYLDVDCVVAQYPARIDALLEQGADFAIFNWLAEEHTEAYVPVKVVDQEGGSTRNVIDRYYRYSHSIDLFSQSQLSCSGMTQLYNNTPEARALLREWHAVVESSPQSADDHCLDFAFNNAATGIADLKAVWLDKTYARYGWWIYARPVIDHPGFPFLGNGFVLIEEKDGKRRFYPDAVERHAVDFVFPRDCLIDTQEKILLRIQGQNAVRLGPITQEIWL